MKFWGRAEWRRGIFCGLIAIWVILVINPLSQIFQLSLKDPLYSHMILVPLISGYLIFSKKKRIFESADYCGKNGIAGLILAVSLYLIASIYAVRLSKNDYLTIVMLGSLCWLIGGFIICYGSKATREALFPLLFLAFMIPVPSFVLKPVMKGLQIGSTEMSDLLFRMSGTPVFREGFIFSLAGLNIEVAEECGGIRGFLGLVIVSVLAGHFFLSANWRKMVLVACALPIAIFRNAFRIVALSLVSIHVDPNLMSNGILHGQDGGYGGKVTFVMSLLLLFPILWALRRAEKEMSLGFRHQNERKESESNSA
jgi:exosortase